MMTVRNFSIHYEAFSGISCILCYFSQIAGSFHSSIKCCFKFFNLSLQLVRFAFASNDRGRETQNARPVFKALPVIKLHDLYIRIILYCMMTLVKYDEVNT